MQTTLSVMPIRHICKDIGAARDLIASKENSMYR